MATYPRLAHALRTKTATPIEAVLSRANALANPAAAVAHRGEVALRGLEAANPAIREVSEVARMDPMKRGINKILAPQDLAAMKQQASGELQQIQQALQSGTGPMAGMNPDALLAKLQDVYQVHGRTIPPEMAAQLRQKAQAMRPASQQVQQAAPTAAKAVPAAANKAAPIAQPKQQPSVAGAGAQPTRYTQQAAQPQAPQPAAPTQAPATAQAPNPVAASTARSEKSVADIDAAVPGGQAGTPPPQSTAQKLQSPPSTPASEGAAAGQSWSPLWGVAAPTLAGATIGSLTADPGEAAVGAFRGGITGLGVGGGATLGRYLGGKFPQVGRSVGAGLGAIGGLGAGYAGQRALLGGGSPPPPPMQGQQQQYGFDPYDLSQYDPQTLMQLQRMGYL